MKLKLHIDEKAYKLKPTSSVIGGIKARLQKSEKPSNIEVKELMQKIANGHSISPAVMNGMSADNWQEQQLFLVDIDNEQSKSSILTIKEALAICEENNLPPAFYYKTFSHSKSKPKYRLAFIMDKPIADKNKRQIIMDTLVSLFSQSDKACVNADRIFLGTNNEVTICDLNTHITMEEILGAYIPVIPKNSHNAQLKQAEMADPKLNELKQNFNFLEYLAKRNGEYKENNKFAVFKNCEICGHKDDLVYYKETNTFYCFSSSGNVGGSIIDYIMKVEGLTVSEAINKFKNELCEPDWQTPIPFEEVMLPDFPVDCLPAPLKEWVIALAESTETTVDMAAVSALAIVASAVQGKFEIEGKPDYFEPLNLYILIIAKSGERKSAIIKSIIKALRQYETEENQKRKPIIEQQKSELNSLKNEIEKLEKKGNVQEAQILRLKRMEIEDNCVKPFRLLADDTTSEALTSLLAESNGILTIISTEGGIFDTLAGRYQDSVSIDTVLKAHSGDLIRVDRKSRDSESINHPALTMLLSAQEDVLNGLLNNEAFRSRGLTARILYCRPTSKMGSRQFNTPEIPSGLEETYNKMLLSLLKIPLPENGIPAILKLDKEAFSSLEKFHNWFEPKLAEDLEIIEGWGGKFIGATLRIAGILHCAENKKASSKVLVSKNTMKQAIKIARYFLEHAKYTYSVMGADKVLEGAKLILKKLKKQTEQELIRSQIHKLVRGRFNKVDDIVPSIELLIEHGYLDEKTDNTPTGGRPKGSTYILNPKYFKINS